MSHKLLLADDSVTIQRVIELTFADEDVDVLTAGDGEQAIASIQSNRPDIVLADVGMPKRSGYDVAAFVKGAPEFAHIPVLLLTGAFEPVDERRARASGCDGVLVKPFEPQHVIARVRELLESVPAGGTAANGTAANGTAVNGAAASSTVPGAAPRAAGSVTRAVSDVPRPAERLAPHRPQPARSDVPGSGEDHGRPAHDSARLASESLRPAPENLRPAQEEIHAAHEGDQPSSDLEAYFDRLDAAFAGVAKPADTPEAPASTPPPRRDGPVMEQDLDWFDAPSTRLTPARPHDAPRVEHAPPVPAAASSWTPPPAAPAPVAEPVPVTFANPPVSPAWTAPQPPSIEPPDTPPVRAPQPAQPLYGGRDVSRSGSIIADAFSALLAAEQGDADAPAVRLGFGAGAPAVTDEIVEEITQRVVQRLGSHATHDLVADVVSRVAERLVREEIERIRNKHS